MFPDNLCRKERTSRQARRQALQTFGYISWLGAPMLHLAVKSLEINSYKMRLGFNWGFSFSVSPVTYIK
jgi:hypothetical protein